MGLSVKVGILASFVFILKHICNAIQAGVPITLNNPSKASFSNKKYPITIQTRPTQIVKVYFLLKNLFLTDF